MKTSAKRLTLSILLLLGPTVLVGWLGLREIGRLEEEVATTLTGGADVHLRSAEQQFRTLLERHVEASLRELAERPRGAVHAGLRELPDEPPDGVEPGITIAALLLAPNGRPVFPLAPPRGRTTEPTLVPVWTTGMAPAVKELLIRIDAAEWFAKLEDFEEGLGTLVTLSATDLARKAAVQVRGRLAYEIGRFRARQRDYPGALADFRRARSALEGPAGRARARAGLQALYLLSLIREAEMEDHVARARNGNATEPEPRIRATLDILEGIAEGDFDAEQDEWLQWMYDRTESLVEPYADGDDQLQLRLDDLRERNRRRVTLRLLAQDVQAFGLSFPQEGAPDRIDTRQYTETKPTSLLAFRSLTIDTGQAKERFYACLHLDLAKLYQPLATKIEQDLSSAVRPYRIDLVDLLGNSVLNPAPLMAPAEQELADKHTTRHSLGLPLLNLSLVAIPRDPERSKTEAMRSIWIKSVLLLGLALVAGAGAFMLVRTVRREAELASMKTDFVGRVSHELKTPLALIRMYGETLAMGRVDDPEKVTQFAGIIATESDRLTGMIDNVLDFAQIEAGTKKYEAVDTRLDVHLQSVLASYEPHLADHGFELRWARMPAVRCLVDPEGLTQAVVNLLSNARKYTADPGRGPIEVRLRREGEEAWIEVLDAGEGVPEPERERIFETFYRASTAGEKRGAGLGLALVKHFAEHHGGCAVHEHRASGGSVFRIVLPLAEDSESGPPPPGGDSRQPGAST